MYIAIEGTKGVGKSTLLEQLKLKLVQDGIGFSTFSPTKAMPTHIWWEQAYQQYANDDGFISDLYTARANYHAQHTNFSSSFILGDRSMLTSFVTRWPDQPTEIQKYIHHVQKKEHCVPIPDFVIYLDLPIEVTLHRLANRKRQYGLYDEQIERLIQAKFAYEQFFKLKNELGFENLSYQYVDAEQSPEDLVLEIYTLVQTKLDKSMILQ
ncbi:dTMP kinase [Acinetobacter sichuanensis]|uniref:dTMP kinase n=1 Tax=Acinetobacter sichuanensis TaxID=2136183 RepID=A0A371YPR2_9GAMM|nr:deoxynucleoside kinase [Acinetobacter sichuanensis]MDQ9021831.1 hypothetical protein [Acinetobacter sichuanensis]RFC83422.1 hypothetical protein C9E89_011270 [Acinetobacter sichuanensis]